MKCIRDELMLSQYREKDLDAETMEQMTSHLQECPVCRKEMKRLETAVKIIQSIEEVTPPRDYLEAMHNHLKK